MSKIFFGSIVATILWAGASSVVAAGQPVKMLADQTAAPSDAMSAQFVSFLTDVLAARMPAANLTDKMKAALSPALLSQISAYYAGFGAFQRLQFVRSDTASGYQRFHYSAVFEKSTQGVMFVTDSSGAIAGFFQDQTSP